MIQFLPDWSEWSQTTDQIKGVIVDFCGPGFYLSDGDTALVLPTRPKDHTGRSVWAYQQPQDQTWELHVWNTRIDNTLFPLLSRAPTRRDKRNLGGSDGA